MPNIYKSSVKTNTNRKIFYSANEGSDRRSFDENDIVLDKPVVIETVNSTYNGRIVSRVKDHIITSNNEYILIKDIKSIQLKNR